VVLSHDAKRAYRDDVMPILETVAIVAGGAALLRYISDGGLDTFLRGGAGGEAVDGYTDGDPLCNANNKALRAASTRQWNVLTRLARKYDKKSSPTYFPQDWKCIAGTTSKGMEEVLETWARNQANCATQDPQCFEALVFANAQAFEAFGQKLKEKFQHEVDVASKAVGDTYESGKKLLGL